MPLDPSFSVDQLREMAKEAGLLEVSLVVGPAETPTAWLAVEPERTIYPASMIKVPLAAACLLEVATGRRALGDRIEISHANMTANDDDSPLIPGYQATIEELIRLAVERSDNVATNELFDLVGRERATELAQTQLGCPNTRFSRKLSGSEPLIDDPEWDGRHRNAHPASDAAALFARIEARSFPGAEFLHDCLLRQYWNDKLSCGLRPGDTFAHKTGDTDEVTHDGGILYLDGGRTYIVVAYVEMPSTPEHNERFGHFMQRVRELLV
jgi:beta-lactamase class A